MSRAFAGAGLLWAAVAAAQSPWPDCLPAGRGLTLAPAPVPPGGVYHWRERGGAPRPARLDFTGEAVRIDVPADLGPAALVWRGPDGRSGALPERPPCAPAAPHAAAATAVPVDPRVAPALESRPGAAVPGDAPAPAAARPERATAAPSRPMPPPTAPTPAARPASRGASPSEDEAPRPRIAPPFTPLGAAWRPAAPAGTAPSGAEVEPGELLAVAADDETAAAADAQARVWGWRRLRRWRLAALGWVLSAYRLPAEADPDRAAARLEAQVPGVEAAANHRYTLSADDPRRRAALARVAHRPLPAACVAELRLGLVDTEIDLTHPALRGRAVRVLRLLPADGVPADAAHGTAVAALLVGDPASGFPGLLPEARLTAVSAFRRRGRTTDTTAETLLRALDHLFGRAVQVINLSLGGAPNTLVTAAVRRLLDAGVVVVAAVGNDGPERGPRHPAAEPGVIAVGAVDMALHPYPRNNRGIDLVAPGVDVWVAEPGGGAYRSGSSYAAPFVSAAAAVLRAHVPAARVAEALRAAALDLGEPGPDPLFGWGMVQWPQDCD